jgi:hypothetical protein
MVAACVFFVLDELVMLVIPGVIVDIQVEFEPTSPVPQQLSSSGARTYNTKKPQDPPQNLESSSSSEPLLFNSLPTTTPHAYQQI